MEWNEVKGQWKQLKGEVRSRWAKLTDDDLSAIDGEREKLVGAIQERYGRHRQEIEREVDRWFEERSHRH